MIAPADQPPPVVMNVDSSVSTWDMKVILPSDLSGDVGLVLRRRPRYIGDDKPTDELYPVIEFNLGDRWQVSLDDGVKWIVMRRDKWSVGPVLEYRQSFSDKLPRGAHKMPDAFEFGGFAVYRSSFGDMEMRLRRALNSYQGWSGDIAYDGGVRLGRKMALGIELRGSWADSNFSDQFFGLRPRGAHRFGLPELLKNNYFSAGTEWTLGYHTDDRTSFFAQASADRIYGEEWRSPILKSRNIFIFSLGMTRHFGVSRGDWPS